MNSVCVKARAMKLSTCIVFLASFVTLLTASGMISNHFGARSFASGGYPRVVFFPPVDSSAEVVAMAAYLNLQFGESLRRSHPVGWRAIPEHARDLGMRHQLSAPTFLGILLRILVISGIASVAFLLGSRWASGRWASLLDTIGFRRSLGVVFAVMAGSVSFSFIAINFVWVVCYKLDEMHWSITSPLRLYPSGARTTNMVTSGPPLSFGLAANLCVLAGGVVLSFMVTHLICKHLTLKWYQSQHACIRCGYAIGELTLGFCPECGPIYDRSGTRRIRCATAALVFVGVVMLLCSPWWLAWIGSTTPDRWRHFLEF